jgi:hypothetical protein
MELNLQPFPVEALFGRGKQPLRSIGGQMVSRVSYGAAQAAFTQFPVHTEAVLTATRTNFC